MKRLLLLAFAAATTVHAATQITWKRQQLHGDFYSEGAAIGDINGDGKPDVVAGPFWWEGPAFEKKHAYYEPKIFNINGYSDNFFAYVHDFNADQKNDILILGFPGKEARLYLNPGTHDDKPWPMHIVADVVDNESPVFTDITGDGKPEIVCSTGGKFGWFAPNWEKPAEKWPFVAVTEDMKVAKFTHGLGVGDVNGDGKLDLLEARRWWENKPGSATWEQHNFAAGIGGGAQMFAYDFDGNGTNDVFTSLAAHRYGVAVYLQQKTTVPASANVVVGGVKQEVSGTLNVGPTWQRVMLASEQPQDNDYGIVFSQPHAAYLADIDGDGVQDIVTGKRYWAHNGHDPDERGHRVIYWYQTKRDGKGGVDFVPHLVDAESGVGVDVQVGDVNGDKLPDIVVGNKAGVFILTQERKDTTADLTPKKMYGPALMPQKDYAHGTRVSGERLRPAGSLSRPAEDRPKAGGGTSAGEGDRTASGGTPDAARGTRALPHALDLMQLPGGFKAELIAAEPDLVQPIAFTFDERGRIWVVEGNSYPKPREVGAGQDRIKILEDKDGDGVFETKKIFCEGLNLVSGIELGFGGVWVGAAPYLMFIPRDGDKPLPLGSTRAIPGPSEGTSAGQTGARNGPSTQVPGLNFTAYALLDGWGSQDTHETLNSFIWGPDGWLYGCHGVFTHSKVGKPGTPDDQRKPINAGIWRYHPTRHEFEIFAEGTSNPWGLDYDQHGEFFVTACVIPHLYHIVPGGRYQRQAGQHFNPYTYEDIKTIADHAHYAGSARPDVTFDKTTGAGIMNNDTNALGGGHAHCGLAIYQSSLFPPTYRNQLLFGNLHGHRLVSNYTDPHASTYIGKHGSDFMRANDMNFIPVTQKVGPDGALYVSDWSDVQICHRGSNAVENWDRSNGRIYRISYDGWKPWKGDLAKENNETLAKLAVQTENEWESRMARRVLMEHANQPDVDRDDPLHLSVYSDEGPSKQLLRSLWCRAMVGNLDIGPHHPLWDHPDEVIRARLVRLFSSEIEPQERFEAFDDRFAKAGAAEPSPAVRRELASMLQKLPTHSQLILATALLKHGEDKDDPMIPLLIWYGIEPLVGADAKAGLQLAAVSKIPTVTEFIYRRMGAEEGGRLGLLKLASQSKDSTQRDMLIKTVLKAGLAGNAIKQPQNWETMRARLLETPAAEDPYPRKQAMTELEGLMGIPAALDELRALLTADKAAERGNALKILVLRKDTPTAGRLQEMLGWKPMISPSAQRESLQALAVLKDPKTPEVVGTLLKDFAPDVLPDAVNTLASTKEGAKELLRAVQAKAVPATALSPFLVRQLTAFDDKEINALIKSAWGDVNAPKADLAERTKKYREILTPATVAKGDLAKGKMLFTMTCGQCHKLFGEGQNVGPDITGSNRADLNYLLENVLDPNAVIGKAYQLNVFSMKDGRVMSGVIKEESPATVRIAMMGGIEFTLPQKEIGKREVSKLSTMPEGLFDALKPEQVIDLVKYLQSGASGPAKAGTTIPGATEGETLKVLNKTGGNAKPQGMGGFGKEWSGASQLWWTGGRPGQKLTLALPVAEKGKYRLLAALTLARDYGIIDVSLDGKPVATAWDGYNGPKVIHSDELDWGTHELSAGEHQLIFTITGKNVDAVPGYMVGLDYVKLEKK
ncbi:PVC-type heme-binding CxxCH protein [Prosthecobacter sp.]|uniref:PVC-type heme-binding CxxCH protein n=1 Tax=Prosthecobacter sp. TaxID=1965333 RepID=UPI003782EDD2